MGSDVYLSRKMKLTRVMHICLCRTHTPTAATTASGLETTSRRLPIMPPSARTSAKKVSVLLARRDAEGRTALHLAVMAPEDRRKAFEFRCSAL